MTKTDYDPSKADLAKVSAGSLASHEFNITKSGTYHVNFNRSVTKYLLINGNPTIGLALSFAEWVLYQTKWYYLSR